jgi:hypothetical protein
MDLDEKERRSHCKRQQSELWQVPGLSPVCFSSAIFGLHFGCLFIEILLIVCGANIGESFDGLASESLLPALRNR